MFDVTRESPLYYTHAIELNDGRTCDRTRLIVKIRQSREACLNPFDVRFENGAFNHSNFVSHILIVVCVHDRFFFRETSGMEQQHRRMG